MQRLSPEFFSGALSSNAAVTSSARGPSRAGATAEDHAICKAAIRTGSRSFYAASLLLPFHLRRPAYALYAFCRLSDDAVDLQSLSPEERQAAVARLRERLDRAYLGAPYDAPADRAFAEVAAAWEMPRALPAALLEGLAWDAESRRYRDFSALRAYAARVAGAVGAMMAVLMRARSPAQLARACDLGLAMQLTNIARDVGEDARAGRVYLPLDWLAEAGVDPDALIANPKPTLALRSVVARLLAEARVLYERAEPGIARLPLACRPAIWSARYLYAEIGEEVARRRCDAITHRAVIGRHRKLTLVGRALGKTAVEATMALQGDREDARLAAPAPETRFLVDAAATQPTSTAPASQEAAWWDYGERVSRVMDVFVAMDQAAMRERDRIRRS